MCYNIKVFNTPPMATTMTFTETELEFLSSFMLFSYIKYSPEQGTETEQQMFKLIGRLKAEETKLQNK